MFDIPTSFDEILVLHGFRLNGEAIRCNGDQCCVREFFVMCAASCDVWRYARNVVTKLSCDSAIRVSLRKTTIFVIYVLLYTSGKTALERIPVFCLICVLF